MRNFDYETQIRLAGEEELLRREVTSLLTKDGKAKAALWICQVDSKKLFERVY